MSLFSLIYFSFFFFFFFVLLRFLLLVVVIVIFAHQVCCCLLGLLDFNETKYILLQYFIMSEEKERKTTQRNYIAQKRLIVAPSLRHSVGIIIIMTLSFYSFCEYPIMWLNMSSCHTFVTLNVFIICFLANLPLGDRRWAVILYLFDSFVWCSFCFCSRHIPRVFSS